jgi:hypothetical protein
MHREKFGPHGLQMKIFVILQGFSLEYEWDLVEALSIDNIRMG